jgi:hypothetical protein
MHKLPSPIVLAVAILTLSACGGTGPTSLAESGPLVSATVGDGTFTSFQIDVASVGPGFREAVQIGCSNARLNGSTSYRKVRTTPIIEIMEGPPSGNTRPLWMDDIYAAFLRETWGRRVSDPSSPCPLVSGSEVPYNGGQISILITSAEGIVLESTVLEGSFGTFSVERVPVNASIRLQINPLSGYRAQSFDGILGALPSVIEMNASDFPGRIDVIFFPVSGGGTGGGSPGTCDDPSVPGCEPGN